MKKIKKFISILNMEYTTVPELFSYVCFLQYQFFGDLMFCIISITSALCLYFELNISIFSAVIIFCLIEFFKMSIDIVLLYFFNKRLIKKRINGDSNVG